MRGPCAVGIGDGARRVPLALGYALLGEPVLPRVEAVGWRVQLVAEQVRPEVGEAVGVGTVKGDLDGMVAIESPR